MTYSIVARDSDTGRFGIAIHSHFFCVGDGPPWARAGVGAVCTQAFTEVAYGPRGLADLEAGRSAADTVARLVASDPGRDRRQVGVVDGDGRAAAYTGQSCIGYAGDTQSEGVTAQANMVASPTIWRAMVEEFQSAAGDLADRLIAALFAAEAEGGDSRGRQSAALLVTGDSGESIDLRVDDHAEPLDELARLLRLRRAYEAIGRALRTGLGEPADPYGIERSLGDLRAAAATLGDNPEAVFWEAVILAREDRVVDARERLRRCADSGNDWTGLFSRLADAGLVSTETAALVLEVDRAGR